jgi:hypothetical protein
MVYRLQNNHRQMFSPFLDIKNDSGRILFAVEAQK